MTYKALARILLRLLSMLMPHETLPRISANTALFLDFDGTLVEIASEPGAVLIPPTLTSTLAALYSQLDGALALVSGRRLLDLDGFLAPLQLPAAVEHGAQRRNAQGQLISAPAADLRHVLAAAEGLIRQYPDLQLEHKNLALSLHYRHAPHLEALCLEVMRAAVAQSSGLQLMLGKCVIDLKLTGFSKGTAIAAFMTEAPFAGRIPLFAGDDVTDEDGFRAVRDLGGHAVKVGPGDTTAPYRCAGVPEMATWLQSALVPSLASRAESLPS